MFPEARPRCALCAPPLPAARIRRKQIARERLRHVWRVWYGSAVAAHRPRWVSSLPVCAPCCASSCLADLWRAPMAKGGSPVGDSSTLLVDIVLPRRVPPPSPSAMAALARSAPLSRTTASRRAARAPRRAAARMDVPVVSARAEEERRRRKLGHAARARRACAPRGAPARGGAGRTRPAVPLSVRRGDPRGRAAAVGAPALSSPLSPSSGRNLAAWHTSQGSALGPGTPPLGADATCIHPSHPSEPQPCRRRWRPRSAPSL